MEQPIPKVTRVDVERIVGREYSVTERTRALAILDEYHSDGSDPSRVQVAALKLAAGDLSALRRAIETAKSDFRDVLAYAEYPRYSRETGFDHVPESVQEVVVEEDWRQYETWLKT